MVFATLYCTKLAYYPAYIYCPGVVFFMSTNQNNEFDVLKVVELARLKKYEITSAGFAVLDKIDRINSTWSGDFEICRKSMESSSLDRIS